MYIVHIYISIHVCIWGLMNGNWLLPRLRNRSTFLPREYVSIILPTHTHSMTYIISPMYV